MKINFLLSLLQTISGNDFNETNLNSVHYSIVQQGIDLTVKPCKSKNFDKIYKLNIVIFLIHKDSGKITYKYKLIHIRKNKTLASLDWESRACTLDLKNDVLNILSLSSGSGTSILFLKLLNKEHLSAW